jgi:PAS domain S-box-containing protein
MKETVSIIGSGSARAEDPQKSIEELRARIVCLEEALQKNWLPSSLAASAPIAGNLKLLAQIFERMPVLITLYHPSLREFHFNNEFRCLLGWREEDLASGDPMEKFYPEPGERERARQHMLAANGLWQDFRVTAKNGAIVDSSWTNIRLADDTQIGIGIDVRQRKAATIALRTNEKLYRKTFENAAVGMAQIDLAGYFMRVNRRMGELLGYAPEELLGRSVKEVTHPEDLPDTLERMEQLNHGAIDQFRLEKRCLHKDGHIVWVQLTVALHRDEEGRPLWYLPIVEDISAIKGAEQIRLSLEASLERRKREAQTLISNAPDMILRFDQRHRILLANPAAERISGFPAKKLLGKTPDELDLPAAVSQRLQKAVELVFATAQPVVLEEEFPSLHGSRQLHLSFAPELAVSGQVERVLAVGRDISPLKRLEEDLRRAKEEAEDASLAKSEFLANMSHEIRTPMTVIMAALEHLQQTEPRPQQEQFLQMAIASSERLLTVIDDILDISKIEARRMEVYPKGFNLRECLEEALSLFRYQAEKKNLQLTCSLAADLPQRVVGDADRIGQIIVNLLGNAVKFTERGSVAVCASRNQGHLAIEVRDTGIGIPRDKQGELFTSFTQVDSSRTRRYGGTGLGLAISKGLAELMAGRIEMDSVEGQGSVFTLILPLCSADQATAAPPRAEPVPLAKRPSTILLAEDEPMVRQMVELVLRQHGWQVVCAENGAEAVQRWQEKEVDLVLMDVQMPGVDGFSATRRIRQQEETGSRRTPIIALTAHARREDRDQCLAAGMDGFLTKPLNLRQLYATVTEHLQRASGGVKPEA